MSLDDPDAPFEPEELAGCIPTLLLFALVSAPYLALLFYLIYRL